MDPLEELQQASRDAVQGAGSPSNYLPYKSRRRIRRRDDGSNSMGTAGFVLSLVGFFSCGILSVLGVIFSAMGMKREPKGLAIAGLVLGIISIVSWGLLVLFEFAVIAAWSGH